MRVLGEDQPLLLAQVLHHVAVHRGQDALQQCNHAGALGGALLLGVAEDPQVHAGDLRGPRCRRGHGHERGVAGDRLTGHERLHAAGRVRLRPGREVRALQRRGRRGGLGAVAARATSSRARAGSVTRARVSGARPCRLRAPRPSARAGKTGAATASRARGVVVCVGGVVELGRGTAQGRRERLPDPGPQPLLELREVVPTAEHGVAGVAHLEAHPQVGRQRLRAEVGGRDSVPAQALQHRGQGGEQRVPGGVELLVQAGDGARGGVRGGHEVAAHGLGQGLDQGGHELHPQPGDVPLELLGGQPVQEEDGDPHGDPVRGVSAGGELVVEVEAELAVRGGDRPGAGEGLRVQRGSLGGDQVLRCEVQQVLVLVASLLPPRVEVALGDHLLGDAGVVEVEEHLVVHPQVLAAHAVLELLHLRECPAVALHERVARLPVALHEGVADEQLARERGVDRGEQHGPFAHQGQAVERDLLRGHHRTAGAGPVGLGVAALDEVRGDLLDPLGGDGRVGARPQPGGLHELRGHEPVRGLLEQGGAREDRKACAARAPVLPAALVPHAHVAQQPGEQGLVHGVLVRGHVDLARAAGVDAHLPRDLAQLGVEVLPLPDPQEVQVLPPAQLAELGGRELVLLLLQVLPQQPEGEEV